MTLESSSPQPSRAVRWLALACFLVSGACGLAYEIVWVRQLTLVAGATTPAVSIVLAVFMGGLALGARLFGAIADRSRNPLKLYAWLELGIALYGLLQPRLLELAGAGYVAVARQADVQGPALFAARLAVAAAVLLLPCVLMGGTLPVLARFVGASRERLGLDLGTLYGLNLAGAVAGSLLTGFVLVRELGLNGTILSAVLGNLLVGVVAFAASARAGQASSGEPRAEPEEAAHPPVPARLRAVLLGLAGLSGFATMGYQVTWTRMLAFGFDNTVYGFAIILVIFLLGLSVGSLVFARLDGRVGRVRLLLGAHVLAGLTALLLAPQALALHQHQILKALTARFGMTGAVQIASIGLGAATVMLLPAVLMGIVFPLVGRLLVADVERLGRELGRAYWVNTAGAILGSLGLAFVLIPSWSLKSCLLALALAQATAGLALLPWCGFSRGRQAGLAVTGALALVGAGLAFEVLLPGPSPFDRLDFGPIRWKLLAHRDDMTASVSVVELRERVRTLRINGFAAATDDESAGYMPMMSHLPMLLHAQPRRVLVICFGTGSTAGAVLLHPGARVDVVDINRAVLGFAPWFERVNHGVFKDPRARLILDDGRNHLLTTRESYDVITSEPMPPTHAGVVNLYSREYYLLARERLAPGGLLVQWLPLHLLEFQESLDILRTVQSVFPETSLWLHSTTGLIVARADGPIRMQWGRLKEAWRQPLLAADLGRLGLREPGAFVRLFTASSPAVAQVAQRGRLITDDRPSLEFHAPRHMLRKVAGGLPVSLLQALATLYPVRAREVLPLDGAEPAELVRVQAAAELQGAQEQGDLELRLGRPGEARLFYEHGLARADGEARPGFLLGLARVARAGGRVGEARQLLTEALALEPGNEHAQALWRELGGS